MILDDFCRGLGEFLTAWRRDRSSNSLKRNQKERLKNMLSDNRYSWRSLEQLANGIGADYQLTKNLLVEIGARPSETDASLWTLK
jgi:hypothetical protein